MTHIGALPYPLPRLPSSNAAGWILRECLCQGYGWSATAPEHSLARGRQYSGELNKHTQEPL